MWSLPPAPSAWRAPAGNTSPDGIPGSGGFFCRPRAADRDAAKARGNRYHLGVVQCKDAFYGQHDPDSMAVGYELKNKWNAWVKSGAKCSEMESAALFIVGAVRRLRVGAILDGICQSDPPGNGTGRSQSAGYDTEEAIITAVDALRLLIARDAAATRHEEAAGLSDDCGAGEHLRGDLGGLHCCGICGGKQGGSGISHGHGVFVFGHDFLHGDDLARRDADGEVNRIRYESCR